MKFCTEIDSDAFSENNFTIQTLDYYRACGTYARFVSLLDPKINLHLFLSPLTNKVNHCHHSRIPPPYHP